VIKTVVLSVLIIFIHHTIPCCKNVILATAISFLCHTHPNTSVKIPDNEEILMGHHGHVFPLFKYQIVQFVSVLNAV